MSRAFVPLSYLPTREEMGPADCTNVGMHTAHERPDGTCPWCPKQPPGCRNPGLHGEQPEGMTGCPWCPPVTDRSPAWQDGPR